MDCRDSNRKTGPGIGPAVSLWEPRGPACIIEPVQEVRPEGKERITLSCVPLCVGRIFIIWIGSYSLNHISLCLSQAQLSHCGSAGY